MASLCLLCDFLLSDTRYRGALLYLLAVGGKARKAVIFTTSSYETYKTGCV